MYGTSVGVTELCDLKLVKGLLPQWWVKESTCSKEDEKEFNACLKYLNKQKRGWQNVETETKLGVCHKHCTQDCRTETHYPLGVINMTCSYILLHCTFFLNKLFYARFKFLYTERQVSVEVQEITNHQI